MVDLMVQLLWSNFFFKSIYESFGSLTRCKLNVDQEEWKWPKNECVGFFNMPKKAVLEEDKKFTFNQYIIFSCLDLFFPLKNITWKIIITTFLCHGPLPFFLSEHLNFHYALGRFHSPCCKEPCRFVWRSRVHLWIWPFTSLLRPLYAHPWVASIWSRIYSRFPL